MSRQQNAATLRKAADLIEKHGWVTGDFGGRRTGFCALGAIKTASNRLLFFRNEDLEDGAKDGLVAWLTASRQSSYQITVWNDYGNTKPDVIAGLRAAADYVADESNEVESRNWSNF